MSKNKSLTLFFFGLTTFLNLYAYQVEASPPVDSKAPTPVSTPMRKNNATIPVAANLPPITIAATSKEVVRAAKNLAQASADFEEAEKKLRQNQKDPVLHSAKQDAAKKVATDVAVFEGLVNQLSKELVNLTPDHASDLVTIMNSKKK